jgi:hypothetical protein
VDSQSLARSDEVSSPKPQIFSLRTPMVSAGTIENVVAETDLMKVSVKIYAEGGENIFHWHLKEDHFFVILDGKASSRTRTVRRSYSRRIKGSCCLGAAITCSPMLEISPLCCCAPAERL